MITAVLMMTGIYTTLGFNIFKMPVYNFTNDDPLFGQILIQSRDGIFVPSPTSGEVFRCTQKHCSNMKVNGKILLSCLVLSCVKKKIKKGLTPIASAASSLSEEKEQLLVCHQVRSMNFSSENFNGNCTYVSDQKKSNVYPAKLVLEQSDKNGNSNGNNNNNKYQGQLTHLYQGHQRTRREAMQSNANTDENEDEDPGIEIAFVLDGSGSIEKNDFETAKNFISTVMEKVWSTCFSCNFGIVQFGREVRTELSLKENKNSTQALEKVKNIAQVNATTKTASALYHVLTDIFVPENGSNVNARKMIILLSDGQMSGDVRNLSDVLEMTEMQGITRFAIGVGPEVLNTPKAIQEMIAIAGSRERFFNVTNYDALETILSSLENSIFSIEGIQTGAGFEFQLAEAGFSSHITQEGSMLFGAVGAYDWSGGIILKSSDQQSVKFLNATKEEPRHSYLGYSVTSAVVATKTLYISGAPRYNLSGAVFIFNGISHDLLLGDQIGSYFGSVVCALDTNNNKETDLLLVGAPHFHNKGEEGKVLVYKQHQGKFERQGYELHGLGKHIYARFGSAIVDIGDIDGDKYRDIAVGAPLEESDDFTESSGSVYIYNGLDTAVRQQFSQRIAPSDFGMKLVHFGQAISVMSGSGQKEELISVGSEGTITVFKTLTVIIINAKITIQTTHTSDEKKPSIPSDLQKNDKSVHYGELSICFDPQRGRISSGELPIQLEIDLDYDHKDKRISSEKKITDFDLTADRNCMEPIKLLYKGCYDCFSPIKIKLNFTLAPTSEDPVRVLDVYRTNEAETQIQFEKKCKEMEYCKAIISLNDSKLSDEMITIGSSQTLDITFNLTNTGESSYMTTLTLTYPEMLQTKKRESNCEVNNNDHKITCKLLHPVFERNEQTGVTIAWQPIERKSNLKMATITAVLTSGINGADQLDFKKYEFKVKNALALQFTGTANPKRLSITEGEESNGKKNLQLIYELLGENRYKAQINVSITIDIQAQNTNVTIVSVEPKICSLSTKKKSSYGIECTMTELQQIAINADIVIDDIQDKNEKITATAELSFDENFYVGKDIMKTLTLEVSLIKITVVKKTAYIIVSAIGGFILLIIIIIILIKCGFFRQRHQMNQTASSY